MAQQRQYPITLDVRLLATLLSPHSPNDVAILSALDTILI